MSAAFTMELKWNRMSDIRQSARRDEKNMPFLHSFSAIKDVLDVASNNNDQKTMPTADSGTIFNDGEIRSKKNAIVLGSSIINSLPSVPRSMI